MFSYCRFNKQASVSKTAALSGFGFSDEEPLSRATGLGFGHFSAANAGGTDAHPLGGSPYAGVNGTQVNVPASLRNVVRVTDSVSGLRLLAADFTLLCHDCC